MKLLSGFSCCQDILATQRLSDGLESSSRQWGTTDKDKGVGAARFVYPITCTPLSATASCTSMFDDPSDAAITTLMNNSCDIDVKQSAYTGAYRVIIIGRS